jgi:hypothetical protein
MLDLLVATDLVRRRMQELQTPKRPRVETRRVAHRSPRGLRASSAAALRGLANLLEPSPTT